MSDITPFYAYIHNISDDITWRLSMIFANRATADEWWRAISESSEVLLNDIRRITPQYYTHDAAKFNVITFFSDARIKSISDVFRGRLFLQFENDRGQRGISIIPPQTICDYVNGGWFYIRSKVEPHIYWHDNQFGIVGSYTHRTRFRVTIHTSASRVTPRPDAILIGSDLVTIQSKANHYVGVNANNGLVQSNSFFSFKFGDLLEGKSVNAVSTSAHGAALSFFAGPDSNPGEFWELA